MKACYVQYNAVTYGVAARGGAAIAWWHSGGGGGAAAVLGSHSIRTYQTNASSQKYH